MGPPLAQQKKENTRRRNKMCEISTAQKDSVSVVQDNSAACAQAQLPL